MSQTRLGATDDNNCSYKMSAAPFYWVFDPHQFNNTHTIGEVGVNTLGGSVGSYVRPDVIDISSFLSGRDELNSKCNPPVPGLDEIKQEPLKIQKNDISMLIPKETKEKKSATNLGSISYDRWELDLPTNPQDIRFVIESVAAQRGGLDTKNFTKMAWNPTTKRNSLVNGNPNSCNMVYNPTRHTGWDGVSRQTPVGKPQPNYPFVGITSQQVKEVGAGFCGDQQFWGPNYEKGSCGNNPKQQVLNKMDPVFKKMAQNEYSSIISE